MVWRRFFWICLAVFVGYLLFYHSKPHTAALKHEQHQDSVDPKYRPAYHNPDGGFGTIDGAKDARDEANRASEQPKKTQQDIDKQ
jgi:hypothetical protein